MTLKEINEKITVFINDTTISFEELMDNKEFEELLRMKHRIMKEEE